MSSTNDDNNINFNNSRDEVACISLHDDSETSFDVRSMADWETLQSKPFVTTVKIKCNDANATAHDECMLQLARVFQSHHHRLEEIHFHGTRFSELGYLCGAVAAMTTTNAPHPKLRLQFHVCDFHPNAAKTLQLMLQANLIGALVLKDCILEGTEAVEAVEAGLAANQSLQTFECYDDEEDTDFTPIQGVQGLLSNTHSNLRKLNLTVADQSFWNAFRHVENNQTLQHLSFFETNIGLPSMEAIIMKCHEIPSLTELSFIRCDFAHAAMNHLVQALSNNNNKILDILVIDSPHIDNGFPLLSQSCGAVQVRKLVLNYVHFRSNVFPTMMEDLAKNTCLQCLDLSQGTIRTEREYQALSNVLLRSNLCPPELVMDAVGTKCEIITNALQHNTSVKSLTIGRFDATGIVTFAKGLAEMNGIRKLSVTLHKYVEDCLPQFFAALEHSMEQNTSLRTLSLSGVSASPAIVERHLAPLRYFLAINRIRRHQLMAAAVPDGLWPHVLANKCAKEPAAVNYVLTQQPDLVVVPHSRKRKACHE